MNDVTEIKILSVRTQHKRSQHEIGYRIQNSDGKKV